MTWRTLIGLPLAGAVVMFLFLLMAGVIDTSELPPGTSKERPDIRITQRPDPGDPPPDRPIKPKDLPPPPPPTFTDRPLDGPTDGGGTRTIVIDGIDKIGDLPRNEPLVPIVRTNPSGFERCIKGDAAEHRVRVQFDVTPSGETTNVRAVASSDRCYDRSAIRAVEGWRYRPKVVNGEPQWVYGVETTIVYEVQ
ncbi:energy transducer TonB [Parvularcula maris]|uniref:Energy transducer TonB n=1 Tax=Parvularcula maris TaxID=2965077 RepID=A0A9X2LAN5_9PROT|nr:energy transducer TonB [Parvularcula maris]MCQ8185994.1 energy transducer TonB [Parvularcula maris]